jgi:hypothetical protein
VIEIRRPLIVLQRTKLFRRRDLSPDTFFPFAFRSSRTVRYSTRQIDGVKRWRIVDATDKIDKSDE